MKTRPSKTKCFIWMFIHITKMKKIVFCNVKDTEGPEGPLRVLFRFLSDRVLLRVFRDRILFAFSVMGSSLGSSARDSSLGSSVVFFRHAAIFYQNVLLLLLKAEVLFDIIFSKRTSPLTISSEKNEEILAWYKHEILYWEYMSSTPLFIYYLIFHFET